MQKNNGKKANVILVMLLLLTPINLSPPFGWHKGPQQQKTERTDRATTNK